MVYETATLRCTLYHSAMWSLKFEVTIRSAVCWTKKIPGKYFEFKNEKAVANEG